MNKIPITLFSILLIISCHTDKKTKNTNEYPRWVGDIEQDSLKDGAAFETCNGDDKIFQYFNSGEGPKYAGEKSSILAKFDTEYKPVIGKDQNGLIRIRFVVNCKGKAGRFRILQSDFDYNEIEFDKEIVSQLLDITKNIEIWETTQIDGKTLDYYFYLIFKIKDGQIEEILP